MTFPEPSRRFLAGTAAVDRVTLLDVAIDVETRDGRTVTGSGSMPLGNVWAFPARDLPYDATLGAMRTLADWIRRDGLWNIKIQLRGESLEQAVERTFAIARIARENRPDAGWRFCADFNERCPNVDYVLDYLRRIEAASPATLQGILYVEQPNARDLGYTGVALKACKGQSHTVLMTAAAEKHGMFVCVQDLTCPGAALVHSAGIAAWVRGVAGIEANARQYVPEANRAWEERLPGLFRITDGRLHTACLADLPGLGTGGPT